MSGQFPDRITQLDWDIRLELEFDGVTSWRASVVHDMASQGRLAMSSECASRSGRCFRAGRARAGHFLERHDFELGEIDLVSSDRLVGLTWRRCFCRSSGGIAGFSVDAAGDLDPLSDNRLSFESSACSSLYIDPNCAAPDVPAAPGVAVGADGLISARM